MSIGELWLELEKVPGRFGVLVGDSASGAANIIGIARGGTVTAVSRYLTTIGIQAWRNPEAALRGRPLLGELELLFAPEVSVDPLRLLERLSRRSALVAVWPGDIVRRSATFSAPGRPDHYDSVLPTQAIVLRAQEATFADQVPYEVERN